MMKDDKEVRNRVEDCEVRKRRNKMKEAVLRRRGSLLSANGVREFDSEVWQERGSLRRRKEAQASAVSDISVDSCYF